MSHPRWESYREELWERVWDLEWLCVSNVPLASSVLSSLGLSFLVSKSNMICFAELGLKLDLMDVRYLAHGHQIYDN